jgi:hypothetical protein
LATASSPPKLKGMCKIRRYPANVLHISSLSHGMSAEITEYSCGIIPERHTSMSVPLKYIPTMDHFAHQEHKTNPFFKDYYLYHYGFPYSFLSKKKHQNLKKCFPGFFTGHFLLYQKIKSHQ